MKNSYVYPPAVCEKRKGNKEEGKHIVSILSVKVHPKVGSPRPHHTSPHVHLLTVLVAVRRSLLSSGSSSGAGLARKFFRRHRLVSRVPDQRSRAASSKNFADSCPYQISFE